MALLEEPPLDSLSDEDSSPKKSPTQKLPPLPPLTESERAGAQEVLNRLFGHDAELKKIVDYIFSRANRVVTTMDLFDRLARDLDRPLALPRDLLPYMSVLQGVLNAEGADIILVHEQRANFIGYVIRLRTEADTIRIATQANVKIAQEQTPPPAPSLTEGDAAQPETQADIESAQEDTPPLTPRMWLEQSPYAEPDQALAYAVLGYLIEYRGAPVTITDIMNALPENLRDDLDRSYMRTLIGRLCQDENSPYGVIQDGSLARFTFDTTDRLRMYFSPLDSVTNSNFREPSYL